MIVRPINTKGKAPVVTSPFSSYHYGIDYGYAEGEPVYATDSGRISFAKYTETRKWIANQKGDPYKPLFGTRALRTEDYGNFVKIVHNSPFSSLYAHLKPIAVVKAGDIVIKGQLIGYVGSTGNSTGNHLHFEYRNSEKSIDPSSFMDVNFKNYGGFQPSPIEPTPMIPANISRKSSFFDVLWQGWFGTTIDTDSINREDVDDRLKESLSEKGRSGLWDQLCQKAGLSGDTNKITVNQLYDAILNQGIDEAAIRKDERTKTLVEVIEYLKLYK